MRAAQYYFHLTMLLVKENRKKSTKHQKQPEPYITNDQYEEPLEQRKAFIVPVKRTYGLFLLL